MTYSRKTMILMLVVLVALFSAFSLGKMVSADVNTSPAPGSADDPLVSRSYVDQKISTTPALENRIKTLEAKVAELEKKLGSSTYTPPSNPPSSNGNQGSVEKKVYPKRGRNWANIRTAPSTSASLLTQCYPGNAMTLLRTQNDWFEVRMSDGRVGWVHNSVAEIR